MIVIDRVIQKQILLLVLFFSMIEPVSGIGAIFLCHQRDDGHASRVGILR